MPNRMRKTMCRVVPLIALLAQAAFTAGCPLIAGFAVVSAIDIGANRQTVGRLMDDAAIEHNISKSIHADPELLEDARIKATAVQGLVLLVGEAPNAAAGLRAARIASETPEVRQVVNKIEIGAVANKEEQNDEVVLVARAKTRMLRHTGITAARINIVGHRGTLYLMGLVTDDEGTDAANSIRLVKGLNRVVKIFHYIQ